jgi:uncharacterized protein (DUF983 family)
MSDYPPVSPVAAGLSGRCPRCGQGDLFAGFLAVAPRCTVCGLDLTRENVGDGAIPFIILIVGALGAGIVVWLEFAYAPPVWAYALIIPAVVLVPALALMRPCKGLLLALQYHHKAGDTGQDTFDSKD